MSGRERRLCGATAERVKPSQENRTWYCLSFGVTTCNRVMRSGCLGFAVVLLTPDDEGCAKGGTPGPRVRQNVLLELGYFMGHLGRDKVCALKRGSVENPSDFAGAEWVAMDEGNSWKLEFGKKSFRRQGTASTGTL